MSGIASCYFGSHRLPNTLTTEDAASTNPDCKNLATDVFSLNMNFVSHFYFVLLKSTLRFEFASHLI